MDNIFTRNVDKDSYHFYTAMTKLKNGQTAKISFQESCYMDRYVGHKHTQYNVCFVIATKKKHMESILDNPKITGKAGLEGLIWAKNKMLEFEKYIIDRYPREKILMKVDWADNRRRDVYTKALAKHGYIMEYRYGSKSLYKELKNVR